MYNVQFVESSFAGGFWDQSEFSLTLTLLGALRKARYYLSQGWCDGVRITDFEDVEITCFKTGGDYDQ